MKIFLLYLSVVLILIKPSYSVFNCAQNQYETSSGCVTCDITCETCDGPIGSNCLSCDNNTRTFESIGGTCYCKDGYKQSSTVVAYCQPLACDYSCQNCKTTQTFCTSCEGSTRTLNAAAGTCNCNTHMFDSGVAVCDPCDYTCQQCAGLATTCTQCDSSKYRQLVGSLCNCMDKYFDVTNNEVCSPCSYKCVTCTGSATSCNTCQANRNSVPTCACLDSFYDDGVSASCLSCQYSCKTCSNYTACTSCDAAIAFRGLVLAQISTYCECLDGYFEDKSTPTLICQSCDVSCLQCTNGLATGCSACNTTANRRLSSTSCVCSDGYYETASTVQHCSTCNSRCRTCVTSATNCVTCSSSLFRATDGAGSCPCIQGYYQTTNTLLCAPCHSSCKSCTNSTQCFTCDTTVKLYALNASNLCSCPVGKYFNTTYGQCRVCPYNCLSCSSISVCLSCGANRSLTNTGTCPCILFHYDDGSSSQCSPCHYTCTTCNGLTDATCLTCNSLEFRTLSGGKCSCQDGYYDDGVKTCKKCYYSCKTCTSAGMCSTCENTLFRTDAANKCPCLSNYYQNMTTLTCAACAYHCLTCLDSVTCETCSASRTRNLLTLKCQCPVQYYEVPPNQSCLSCQYSCKTCTNYTACTSCDAAIAFRGLVLTQISTYCECLDGYFEDKSTPTLICQSCDVSCLQCTNGLATGCSACNTTANRRLSSTSCVCSDGYYETASTVQHCSTCNSRCRTCVTSATNCVTCSSSLFRATDGAGSCPCIQGYYQTTNTLLCAPCHSSCKSCTNSTQCFTCDTTVKLYALNASNLCSCPVGKYFNTTYGQCRVCPYNCLSCSSISVCLSCGANRSLTNTGTCPCILFHYDDGSSSQCSPCHYTCTTCNGLTDATCLTCNSLEFRTLSGGKCSCQDGYYDDGVKTCKKCYYSCKTCTSAGMCSTCENTLFRTDAANKCPCLSNYYQNMTTLTCAACAYHCFTCLDSVTCETCSASRTRNLLTLKCQCPAQQYEIPPGQSCFPCLYDCKSCTNSSQCLTCDATLNRVMKASTSRCVCIDKYFEDSNNLCVACDYDCKTCGASGTCFTCNQTANRVQDTGTGKCVCSLGYYDDGTQECKKCAYACKQCATDSMHCTSCDTTLRTLNSFWCQCPIQKYDNNLTTLCPQCHYTCQSCQNYQYCQGCDIAKFRTFDSLNVKCKCLDKYYDDLTNQLCKSCSYRCMTCTNSSQCKTCDVTKFRQQPTLLCPCIAKYYDTLNNQLCVACQYSCKTCTNATECKTCDTAGAFRIYDSVSKLCICQSGYYNSGTSEVCLKCDYECTTCSTSATHCLTCNSAVTFRQFTANTCPCKSRYYDGNLDAICQKCQYTCETCLNALTCTTCDLTKKRTLNSTTALCQCLQGYYDNNSSQTCQQCHLTCKSCKTSSSCQTCDPARFRLLNSTADYLHVSSNYCVCQYRYYSPGNALSCLPCHYSCEICTGGNSNNCKVCNAIAQRYYNSTSSKCLCNNGYYDDNTIEQCQPCHVSCATCIGALNTQCYTCNGTTFLMLNQTTCYINCPDYHFNNVSNHVCASCSSNCLHCTDSNTCTQCDSLYYLLPTDKKCYAVCPDGWYEDIPTKSCMLCPVGCKTCDSSIKCITCIAHYYLDNSLQICFQCNQFCKDCIGPGQDQCTSCYQPMYFKSNKCHDLICPYGQYVDSTLGCLKCIDKFTNSLTCNKTTPFLCIDTYKIYNNKCQKCNNVPGYHLSKLSNTCSQICGDGKLYDYQCDDGNLLNGDGCASNCIIEDGWQCTIGNLAGKSTCVLQRELNMNIIDIYKYPGKNMVKLYFDLNIPYRLLNKFVVTVQGVDSKYYSWQIHQYSNMSEVYFDFFYTHHLNNKILQIKYDQSLTRRLLQIGSIINIQFSTSLPLESFPPVLYYPQAELLQFSILQQLIYYLSLILIVLSLMSLLVFKKMHLHGLSFIHIPAKIFLIFGLAIAERTDWMNYLLKDIKMFGLIGGISSSMYNYIAGEKYSQTNFTLINEYHSYTTQLIHNSLYVILAFALIYIITIIATFYHNYIRPVNKMLLYCQYYLISIHLLVGFHVVYSSVNVLYHYKIESKEEAFNVTLGIMLVLVNLAVGVVSWVGAKKMKFVNSEQYNQNKLNYLHVKNIDKTIDIDEDKKIQISQEYAINKQKITDRENALQKQFSLISRDQQQQQQSRQQQQSSLQANHSTKHLKQNKQENIKYQQFLNQSYIINPPSSSYSPHQTILHFDYISLYNSSYKLSKYYLPVTFTFLYLQSILICLLQQINPFYFIIIEGSLQLGYFMYVLILRPFKSVFSNLRILSVELMYLALFGITGYYLYEQQQNVVDTMQTEKIFAYLVIGLLIIAILACIFEHLVAWRQQIWSVIQPCLISLRLRGTKKVYDNPQKNQKQSSSNDQIKQKTAVSNQQYEIFYARVLNKEKVNRKYRKQRMIKDSLYKLTN